MNVNEFIESRGEDLIKVAKNINRVDHMEMISDYYIYISKNCYKKSFDLLEEDDIYYFSISWLKNNSTKNNRKRIVDVEKGYILEDTKVVGYNGNILSSIGSYAIELGAEDMTDDMKAYLLDLQNDWSDSQIIKILGVYKNLELLESWERILFDMYFMKEMSLRKIGDRVGIPMSSINLMVNKIKEKLRC
jgi:RNA polymerase sigma factor (sigma-70 family)